MGKAIEARLELVALNDGAEGETLEYRISGVLGAELIAAAVDVTLTDLTNFSSVTLEYRDADDRRVAGSPGQSWLSAPGTARVWWWLTANADTADTAGDIAYPSPRIPLLPGWAAKLVPAAGSGDITLTNALLYVIQYMLVDEDDPPHPTAHLISGQHRRGRRGGGSSSAG